MDKVFDDRLYILKDTIKLLADNDLLSRDELILIMTEIAYIRNGTLIVNKDEKLIESIIVNMPEYKDAMEKISYVDAEDMNSKDNTICPLTKKNIVVTFKGACGHVFERSAIEEYKKSVRGNRCPIPGCTRSLQ